MHFSVIIFAIIMAVLSSFILGRLHDNDSAMTLKQTYLNHQTLFELTIIFGLLVGILIDLLVNYSLVVKFIADIVIVPILACVLIRPFLGTVE